VKTVLQSYCLLLLNDFKKLSLGLVKKLDFDPDPESDPKIPLKSDPDQDLQIFSNPTNYLPALTEIFSFSSSKKCL